MNFSKLDTMLFHIMTILILRAHSVVRNKHKDLIELTWFFSQNSFHFIEHSSGKYGIDLKAQII